MRFGIIKCDRCGHDVVAAREGATNRWNGECHHCATSVTYTGSAGKIHGGACDDEHEKGPSFPMTKAYDEGHKAYEDGKTDTECPYASAQGMNSDRYSWFVGYLDARHEDLGML